MTKRNILRGLLAAILAIGTALSLCACSDKGEDSGKIKVAVTNFPIYDFVRQIAGDNAEITLLLPVGVESHHYEPTPSNIIAIKECDLFLCIGGTDEQWVLKALSENKNEKRISLRLVDSIGDGLCPPIANGNENHSDDGYDQHIWTSPENAKKMLQTVYDALCSVDMENSEIYMSNYEKYAQEITALQTEFKAVADSVEDKTLVFADKFPFTYFAKEFGFSCLAAFPNCTDESEPSAQAVATLIDEINTRDIKSVFYLSFGNKKVADNICNETGASAYALHTCHNVSKEEFDGGESYVSLMKKNLESLKKALLNQ